MKLNKFQRLSAKEWTLRLCTWTSIVPIFIIFTALQSHGTSALVRYGSASIYSLTRVGHDMAALDSGINATGTGTGTGNGSTIFLSDNDPIFSILVPLIPGKSFANKSEASRYFKDFYQGEFYVEAPQGFGIIAVVQILRLFTVTGGSTECLDFIRFREEATSVTPGKMSSKICGKDDEDDFSLHPKDTIGDINFIAESGRLTVELIVVSTLLQSKWQPGKSGVEVVMAIEISFTAYPLKARISEKSTINSNQNNTNILECFLDDKNVTSETSQDISWRPCTGAKALKDIGEDAVFCIHEDLFCDGLIQCGFTDQFAQDENSCYPNSANDADDLIKLQKILQSLHLNDNVINGSRLNPALVSVESPPLAVEITQYFIIGASVVAGILFGACFLYWLKRSHQNFCTRRVEVVGDVVDVSASGSNNGIRHTEEEKYSHRQSVAVIKLDRMLNEYREGRGSRGNNNGNGNGNDTLNGNADSKL